MPTRRQQIMSLLEDGEWTFDELRRQLDVPVAVLREDLRHVAQSARRPPGRLRVTPPRCSGCGFELTPKPGRFTAPSRCPRCRDERIVPPRLSIR